MVRDLIDMGFPSIRAEKALAFVNNSSVQAAMDWIFEHMDDPDIDTASPSAQAQENQPPADTTAQADSPTVHNAMCNECQKQIIGIRYKSKVRADYDLCEKCKKITTAEDDDEFVAHTNDIVNPTLTPEERQLQAQRLQQRIEEIRKKKKIDEETRDREREISRRREGKDTIEAKKLWEEAQAKREADKLRKEKEDEKRAKEAIKLKIQQDRMEREARAKAQSAGSSVAAAAPTPQQPQQAKSYTECTIQIRQLDGSTLRGTFKPTDTLKDVYQHIVANRTDKSVNAFTLVNTYPRKVYTAAELSTSLQEIGRAHV